MILGWKIIFHASSMIFRNISMALKIFSVPFIGMIVALLGSTVVGQFLGLNSPAPMIFAVVVASIVLLLWGVVAWHRYILLEERPVGLIPMFNFRLIAGYFWRGVLLGLVTIPFFLVLAFVGRLFLGAGSLELGQSASNFLTPTSSIQVFQLLTWAITVVLLVVVMRLSLILPAYALDRPIGMGESWEETHGAMFAIVVLVICLSVLQWVFDFSYQLIAELQLIGALWQAVTSLFLALLNVSILTTMYGVFIEKRELS